MNTLINEDVLAGLARHASGDWGDLCDEDLRENEMSLEKGFRLFSVYHAQDGTILYIITEGDRSVTTVLLPEDYQRPIGPHGLTPVSLLNYVNHTLPAAERAG